MKRLISKTEFDRKMRVWTIIIPLITAVLGSLTAILIAYLSHGEERGRYNDYNIVIPIQRNFGPTHLDSLIRDSTFASKGIHPNGLKDSVVHFDIHPYAFDTGVTFMIEIKVRNRGTYNFDAAISFPDSPRIEVTEDRIKFDTTATRSSSEIRRAIVYENLSWYFYPLLFAMLYLLAHYVNRLVLVRKYSVTSQL